MRQVVHPGPVAEERLDFLPADGQPVEVEIAAGIPLEDAVAEALAPPGFHSAYLELQAAPTAQLRYVIPGEAPDDTHVAWYSEELGFEAGEIVHIGMIVGRHGAASFIHGHGTWRAEGGPLRMGHILAPKTVLAEAVTARGIGLWGAGFERLPDAETNFDLFQVRGESEPRSRYAALRVKPNEEFGAALMAARDRLGWERARAHGIGSLIGARFDGGHELGSTPSEFLLTDTEVGGPTRLIIVGTDGDDILDGTLVAGANPVLITAEIVLERLT